MKTAEKAGRLFFAVLGLAGLLLLILPRIGISVDMVLSGSMEPKIRTGGLVFTDTNRKDPQIGDIITYSLNDSFVTHRVVRKEGSTLITKGDANDGEDLAPVSTEQVLGTVIFTIPFLGYLAAFMKRKNNLLPYCILMIAQELIFMVHNELTERRARKKAQEKI